MKAIGYCRVSTSGQLEDGISLDAQQKRIQGWCDTNDYELSAVFVEAMSGGRADNRLELQKALDLACKNKSALVVYSLSRLARSTKDAILISERLDKANADLVSLSERIDTTTPVGKMIFRLLSVLSEFEKDQLSERTKMAMAHLRKGNVRISSKIPFGYDLSRDGRTLKENKDEIAIVDEILSRRGEGESLGTIARELNERGIRTKNNAKWYSSTVKAILDRKSRIAA